MGHRHGLDGKTDLARTLVLLKDCHEVREKVYVMK
jgi:hypothetical protein